MPVAKTRESVYSSISIMLGTISLLQLTNIIMITIINITLMMRIERRVSFVIFRPTTTVSPPSVALNKERA